MNVVRVIVKVTNYSRYAWSCYFSAIPTLEAIMAAASNALGTHNRRTLAVIKAATPEIVSVASASNKPTSWCNLVMVAGVQIGVIEYTQITVNQLEEGEKVLPTSERPQIVGGVE
jgi:hypothetical protein